MGRWSAAGAVTEVLEQVVAAMVDVGGGVDAGVEVRVVVVHTACGDPHQGLQPAKPLQHRCFTIIAAPQAPQLRFTIIGARSAP